MVDYGQIVAPTDYGSEGSSLSCLLVTPETWTAVVSTLLKGIVSRYKAYLLLSELISSKIQLKWVQEVWARPVLRYSVREFVEIERMQREDFVEVGWRSS